MKILENKSFLTNASSLAIIACGMSSSGAYKDLLLNVGFFAFSGGITNWLAIHMLFEKVPFLYGSGVIPKRFEDFKLGIKNLIIDEFFNTKNLEKFLHNKNLHFDANSIKQKIDFDNVFEELLNAIVDSPLGGMLAMVGGKEALLPIKEPIILKLKTIIDKIFDDFDNPQNNFAENIHSQIEQVIDSRLAELTPTLVKEIIQKMIKQHLGWLVVWGGVFGGLIGLLLGLMS